MKRTLILAASVAAIGLMADTAAHAEITTSTKTTTTKTIQAAPVVETNATVKADADVMVTKKSGYVAYDTNSNGYLEPDEYQTYSYNVIDIDGNEYITDSEWDTYTTVWYKPTKAQQYKVHTFAEFDANNDGQIDFEEYTNGPEANVFSTWDADNSGYVDETEYKTVITTYSKYDTDKVYVW